MGILELRIQRLGKKKKSGVSGRKRPYEYTQNQETARKVVSEID